MYEVSAARKDLWDSLQLLDSWLVKHEYRSYDPFDGLLSYLRPLTFHRRFPQQVLQQFVRRNPFNVRPLLGIQPHQSTKGMGFLMAGYAQLHALTGEATYRTKADFCLQWLTDHTSEGYHGACWGNAFDYISRGSDIPKGAPTIVWSGLIGHHLITSYRILNDERYLALARRVAEFVVNDIPRVSTPRGLCLSYVTDAELPVHNANLLGARLLAEVYRETGEQDLLTLAGQAAEYSAGCQLPEGSWYYGEDPMYHWIDNWHTAYNLDALLGYQTSTGDTRFDPAIRKGFAFYEQHFFRPDGAPKYYWNRDYKYDIQSSSQGIDTLTLFGATYARPDLYDVAVRVARWTIRNMQDSEGFFYLWKNRWFTNTTPTIHWGAATMFHALAHLLLKDAIREH
jgi:hypothetical protein